ncbi:exopolysaccharide biosynthesis polyprenyl glycosylphosphotransferase [Nocardioides cavernae]|uniref:Exopolysaccharide biosynthesis polyprenyl glycosylphosphotransferase n=1 Tax=Nocardioides cavernae TaxID=1921566 RepID=A0A7Y9H0R0_9ACTN|nr:sugar transferase [Nocardioides cavernae]NYE35798.1 exopolysaccharide biosynthesis polyprenyl glycosylphosphotransferase [Nocardioides cavernae]
MRPEGIRLLPWLIGAVDLVMIAVATALALRFRVTLPIFDTAVDVLENTGVASVFFGATWVVLLAFFGTYERHVFGAGTEEFKLVVNASFFTGALVATMAYLMQYPLSRGFFVLYFPIGVLLLLVGRLLSRRTIQRLRAAGHFTEKVLLVGTPGYIGEIHTVLNREKWLGYEVMGCLVPSDYAGLQVTSAGVPVLGLSEDVRSVVDEVSPDIVFFTAGAVSSSTALRRLAWDLEDHAHVQIIVAPNVTDVSSERVRIRPVAGLPLMHLGRSRSQLATNDAKRAFDLVGSLLILALTWPLLAFLMIWIKRHDGGPALFRQVRVGREGKEFTCLKLRSMSVDAESRLAELKARDHVLFKSAEDPRITKPGKLIRRFSLDELPQLWNVVRGEMSLVGPRPPLPTEVAQYEDDMLRRLNVMPGMTGLWQVSGRSDLSWEDTVRLDLYYVDNWSMVQDLLILARTVTAVLASRGAY